MAFRPVKPLFFLGGALVVNLIVFGLAPLMASGRQRPQTDESVVAVSLVKLKAPEPPQEEEVKQEAPPETPPPADFKPDLFRPQLAGPTDLVGGIAIDMGDIGGPQEETEFVFEAFELDQAPQVTMRVPPVYPYKAREQAVEGVVQVKLLINPDGSVGQVRILAARPEGIFEEAVRQAVPKWKFSPGMIDGQAVTAWVVTAVRFDLGG